MNADVSQTGQRIQYSPVIPRIEDWPLAQFFRDKEDIYHSVNQDAMSKLLSQGKKSGQEIRELIAKTMYLERIRIQEDPWQVDPKDEKQFWTQIKKELVDIEQSHLDHQAAETDVQNMLYRIVDRYSHEISSTFKPSTYHFAKRVLPFVFSTLLNASAGKTIKSVIYHRQHLQDKIHLVGETHAIRNLSQKGTIVLVPTHLSNVDSILVGWGLHALGLPAFIYGAGLNLYNSAIFAHFMQRLGAYKVDRRKKNPIYLQTLQSYVVHATHQGVHGIFFPGGTRSRSGMIEKRLKLGLIGATIEAQRRNLIHDAPPRGDKIFVVPLVMSYHFVLEAASLINQHLKREGQEQYYLIKDEFASWKAFLKFVWTSFSRTSDITLAFGKPMDVFGNFVDDEGQSYDERGKFIDIKDYFISKGEIKEDVQRDSEYAKMLGDKIVDRFHIENRVFSSHLVAFVAFQMLQQKFKTFDLYSLLRLPQEERMLDYTSYEKRVSVVLQQLNRKADCGQVHLAPHLHVDVPQLIRHGIKNLGIYHSQRPLSWSGEQKILAENMNLLYYYHNRLVGYELEKYV